MQASTETLSRAVPGLGEGGQLGCRAFDPLGTELDPRRLRLSANLTIARLELADEQPQQGRLARAVTAYQTRPAGSEMDRGAGKQRRAVGIGKRKVLEMQGEHDSS